MKELLLALIIFLVLPTTTIGCKSIKDVRLNVFNVDECKMCETVIRSEFKQYSEETIKSIIDTRCSSKCN